MEMMFTTDTGTRREYSIEQEAGTPIDLDDLTILFVRFRKPDRTTFDRDLTPHDTEESVAFYDFVPGELDQSGFWKAQYRAGYDEDNAWWSEWEWFRVWPHIPANEGS